MEQPEQIDPPQNESVAGEIETKLSGFKPDVAMRLRGLYVKWLHPEEYSLTKSQENELISAKLIPSTINCEITGEVLPSFCTSFPQFSKILKSQLGVDCDQRVLANHFRKGFLQGTRDKLNKQISTTAALIRCREKWGDRRGESSEIQSNSDEETEQSIKKDRARISRDREKRANEIEQRKFDDSWMLTEEADNALEASGVLLRNMSRDMMERRVPKSINDAIQKLVTDLSMRQAIMVDVTAICISAFDQLQSDMRVKLVELAKEMEESNKQKKGEMK